ncbi:hypothetical protein CBR_g27876 [Chara braunii]|uniref:1-phosphatidylinositol 4-kinase n=1 Tax=Chara braunii TaxID=69332 RepID=A0A388L8K7_CHABU|nr:hypothetical protein CBR_g27876 [Chara braunii]|eukprot:GBG78650.1 hypothetical protein CBR_g27876 [Chara braunii]
MPPNVGPVRVRPPTVLSEINVHPNPTQQCRAWRRQSGRRRIFVQIDNGIVLDLQLDRAERVDAVKKKVQAALCMPTSQGELIFGGQVLNRDLSEVGNNSPLFLTTGIHRSCSHPSLSSTESSTALAPSSPPSRYSPHYHQAKQASPPLSKESYGKSFEIVGGRSGVGIKRLLREVVRGVEADVAPVRATGGLGGAYFFRDRRGEPIAIVKPTDEEPLAPNNPKGYAGKALGTAGLKRYIKTGEAAVREVAAYLLDHDGFANVPKTVLVKATHSVFHVNKKDEIPGGRDDDKRIGGQGDSSPPCELISAASRWSKRAGGGGDDGAGGGEARMPVTKLASLQEYRKHDFDASDHGTSRFPVSMVHRIGILDVRIFNTDRHSGNILVRKLSREEERISRAADGFSSNFEGAESVELIPIDHGYSLPESLEATYFEWLHWPQASRPFSEEELRYIEKLDAEKDVQMLRRELPTLREACLRMLVLSTTFLKRAAAAGLTLADIGAMMSPELTGMGEEPSLLESICMSAKARADTQLRYGCLDDGGMFGAAVLNGGGDDSDFTEDDDGSFSGEHQFQFDMDNDEDDGFCLSPMTVLSPLFGNYSPSPLSSSPASMGCCGGAGKELLLSMPLMPLEEVNELERGVEVSRRLSFGGGGMERERESMAVGCGGASSLRTGSGRYGSSRGGPGMMAGARSRAGAGGAYPPGPAGYHLSRTANGSFKHRRSGRMLLDDFDGRELGDMARAGTSPAVIQTVACSNGPLLLGDMTEREWHMFMECVVELLDEAIQTRKENALQLSRHGKSCQF